MSRHTLAVLFILTSQIITTALACGDHLTSQAGVISSPNYPDNYPDNSTCNWLITVPKKQIIELRFKYIDIERVYDGYACVDFVRIYDGSTSLASLIGEGICGYNDAARVTSLLIRSSGNNLYINFQSNDKLSRRGFIAEYWAHYCPPFTYGNDLCTKTCSCVHDNSFYCSNRDDTCLCKPGWTGDDCSEDVDECQDVNWCKDPYSTCVNNAGSYLCVCKPGMTKTAEGECQESFQCADLQCSHVCGVTPSSPHNETCYCPRGMALSPENNTVCIDCAEWTFGDNCERVCSCDQTRVGSCDKVTGQCQCLNGWTSVHCDVDVNECSLPDPPCSTIACRNTIGSYVCLDRNIFADLNETVDCDCDGLILTDIYGIIGAPERNVNLSFCGFQICQWNILAPFDQVISFRFDATFVSEDGFINGLITLYNGGSPSTPLLAQISGEVSKAPTNIFRTTTNEMLIVRDPPTTKYDGLNIIGFKATYVSHECLLNMYGDVCSKSCKCFEDNTVSCDNITGQCTCKAGWTSSDCSVDMDECSLNEWLCPDYSRCHNLLGGYECLCYDGLIQGPYCTENTVSPCQSKKCSHFCGKTQSGEQCYCPKGMKLQNNTCYKCDKSTYGLQCEKESSCVVNNTLSCDAMTGNCSCSLQWKGSDCSEDVDECLKVSYTCPPLTNCSNTIGGYTCVCSQSHGYTVEENSTQCVPIDCSYDLTESTGSIESPDYPNNYMHNANCSWNITVDESLIISLSFSKFTMEWSQQCASDYLEVYDGNSTEGRLIGRYCGTSLPNVIRSTTNEMFVVFVSDWKRNDVGFTGTYTAHECQEFTFGATHCNQPCDCVQSNTDYCDNVNGQCICMPGWTLPDCSRDVDECQSTDSELCQEFADCFNTPGSYECECRFGHKDGLANETCNNSSFCTTKNCSHSCFKNETSLEEKCLCPDDLILEQPGGQNCIVPFYPFGDVTKDSCFNINAQYIQISSPIAFSSSVPIDSIKYSTAYVLTNGAILFGDEATDLYSMSMSELFDHDSIKTIAPFFIHETLQSGRVCYHMYDACKSKNNEPNNLQALANVTTRARDDVIKFNALQDLQVKTVLVVTWESLHISNRIHIDPVSFQAVYVSGWAQAWQQTTNGYTEQESSYVILKYSSSVTSSEIGEIGNVSVGLTGDIRIRTDDSMSSLNDLLLPTFKYNGNATYSRQVGQATEKMCNQYLYGQCSLLTNFKYLAEKTQLLDCACTVGKLGTDWALYERRGIKTDVYCYAITMIAKQDRLSGNKRNKLCCYQSSEDLQSLDDAVYLEASSTAGHVLVSDPWKLGYINYAPAVLSMKSHEQCCENGRGTQTCEDFYQIFPDQGCVTMPEKPPAVTTVTEATLTTLDGVTFKFTLWGEFSLFSVPTLQLSLQARTDKAGNFGSKRRKRADTSTADANALVFVAFAAKEGVNVIQIELSPSKTTMLLTANKVNITNEFYAKAGAGLVSFAGSISVLKEITNNVPIVQVQFACGAILKVKVATGALTFTVQPSENMRGKTVGLLGNFNGISEDDFPLPETPKTTMNDAEFFQQISQEWASTSDDSVFQYPDGKSFDDFQHPEFASTFKAPKSRRGPPAGGGEGGGGGGGGGAPPNHVPKIELVPDQLDSSGRWSVSHGQVYTLRTNATDIDNDAVTYETLGNTPGARIDSLGVLTYIPDWRIPLVLGVRAKDARGGYSQTVYIPITICSQCYWRGRCEQKVSKYLKYGWFQELACVCPPAYTGEHCEYELNECSLKPCPVGQNCTDMNSTTQGKSYIGHSCDLLPSEDSNATERSAVYSRISDTSIVMKPTSHILEGVSAALCAMERLQYNSPCTVFSYNTETTECILGDGVMVTAVPRESNIQINILAKTCTENKGFQLVRLKTLAVCVYKSTNKLNFIEARSVCSSMGAHLYTVKFVEKLQLFQSQSLDYWIGLFDVMQTDRFIWADDETELTPDIAENIFIDGSPYNKTNSDCVAYMNASSLLDNTFCHYKFNYACELSCFTL